MRIQIFPFQDPDPDPDPAHCNNAVQKQFQKNYFGFITYSVSYELIFHIRNEREKFENELYKVCRYHDMLALLNCTRIRTWIHILSQNVGSGSGSAHSAYESVILLYLSMYICMLVQMCIYNFGFSTKGTQYHEIILSPEPVREEPINSQNQPINQLWLPAVLGPVHICTVV